MIICFTLRLRGRRGLLFLEWRFDKFFVVLDHFPREQAARRLLSDRRGKSEIINLKTKF